MIFYFRAFLVTLIVTVCGFRLQAQSADFLLPASACLNETIAVENNTTDAIAYQWDFCLTDLNDNGTLSDVGTMGAAATPTAVTAVYDSGNWYGFVSSRDNNKLIRIDFGNSIQNEVTVDDQVDLGNVNGAFNGPKVLRFIKDGDTWYAFGTNVFSATVFRLAFYGGLDSQPVADLIGNLDSWSGTEGIDLAFDGTNWIAAVTSWNNKITLVNFGSSLANTPTGDDVLTIINGEIANPFAFRFYKEGNNWYGVTGSYSSNKLIRLSFGTALYSVPDLADIATMTRPTAIAVISENARPFIFSATASGELFRVRFDSSIAEEPLESTNLGAFGTLANTEGFDIIRTSPSWTALFINYSTKMLSRVNFEGTCESPSKQSSADEDEELFFSEAGTYSAELTAFSTFGNIDVVSKSIVILPATAPEINVTSPSEGCIESELSFAVFSEGAVDSYDWDFGDGTLIIDGGADIVHTFSVADTFAIMISAKASNGCVNNISHTFRVHPAPEADFELPPLPWCTNNAMIFVNATASDASVLQSNWKVNGESVSSDRDIEYTFIETEAQSIELNVSIPGCSSSVIKNLNSLYDGPAVEFSYSNNCFQEPIIFSQNIDDSISGFLWDFGDGETSGDENPSHLFAPGTYQVLLEADNDVGCKSSKTLSITVTDQPLADFSVINAVENLPIEVIAIDLTQADDHLVAWKWLIDDSIAVENDTAVFVFDEPGLYPVQLSVITEQGCDEVVNKVITVAESVYPIASFDISTLNPCVNEKLMISNTTVNAASTHWDLCFDDLLSVSPSKQCAVITDANVLMGIDVIHDKDHWIGLATSRENDKIFRLSFGDSLTNSPVISEVGGLSDVLNGPKTLKILQDSGRWVAIGVNFNSATLFVLDFKNGLDEDPVAKNLGNLDSWNTIEGFDILYDGENWIGIVSSYGNHRVSLIKFGAHVLSDPDQFEIKTIFESPDEIASPYSVKLLQDQGNFYGIISSYSSGAIYRLSFGEQLFSTPVIDEIFRIDHTKVTNVWLQREGVSYYAFVTTRAGDFYRIDFSHSLSSTKENLAFTNLGNLSLLSDIEGFVLVRDAPIWHGFFMNFITGEIYRSEFSGECAISMTETNVLTLTAQGMYPIELTAVHSNGTSASIEKLITVSDLVAPEISISASNQHCLDTEVHFGVSSGATILNYVWDFGDQSLPTETESSAINHQFISVGNYVVSVTVEADNGCRNLDQKQIAILNTPMADFHIPEVEGGCSEQRYLFENFTTSDDGSVVDWLWEVDGEPQGSDLHFEFAFDQIGEHEIKLTAGIPGCENSKTNLFTISHEGVDVDFESTVACIGDSVLFTNTSPAGEVFEWQFSDNSFAHTNEVYRVYNSPGVYSVKLTNLDNSVCQNFLIKDIQVFRKPLVDFSLTEASVYCDNTPVIFSSETTSPEDAVVETLYWEFDEDQHAHGEQVEHIFKGAGSYEVSLKATASSGCFAVHAESLTILPSPDVAPEVSASCVGTPTHFNALTSEGVVSWEWMIDDKIYKEKSPSHIFRNPGNFDVILKVSHENGCTASSASVALVPEPLEPVFSVENNCATYTAILRETTIAGEDAIIGWEWTINETEVFDGNAAEIVFNTPSEQNVKLMVTTESGCSYVKFGTFEVVPAPLADFNMSSEIGAPPFPVDFENKSINASGYNWSFGDGATSEEFSPQHVFKNIGEFTITLTAFNEQGCEDQAMNSITISEPHPDVSIMAITTTENPDGSLMVTLVLQNEGNTIINDLAVDIDVSGNLSLREVVEGAFLPLSRKYLELGYGINITDNVRFLCAEADLSNDVTPHSNRNCIEFADQFMMMPVYPNPVKEILGVQWISTKEEKIRIALFNSLGTEVWSSYFEAAKGLNQQSVNVEGMRKGVYMLVFEGIDSKTTQRVLLTR
jgi:PKD repeat protein